MGRATVLDLTLRQRQVRDFIRDYKARNTYAPTIREVCEQFGWSSPNAAHRHLKNLAIKGAIKRGVHKFRAIEVKHAGIPIFNSLEELTAALRR
jgi:repressor LexA